MTAHTEPALSWGAAKTQLAEKITEVLRSQMRPWARVKVALEPVDLLGWLAAQKDDTRIYWSDATYGLAVAAVGICEDMIGGKPAEIAKVFAGLGKAPEHIRFYGGICFDPANTSADWRSFSCFRFIIPRFEILKFESKYWLCCNCTPGHHKLNDLLSALEGLSPPDGSLARLPALRTRIDRPSRSEWGGHIDQVLSAIHNGSVEKVVLARESIFEFDTPLDACVLLKVLENLAPQSSRFLFQFAAGAAFFGASPEKLYHRHGRMIQSDAIAGSRPSGTDEARIREELMNSPKDEREHRFVVDHVVGRLGPLCETIEHRDKQILALKNTYHLATRVKGRLKPEATDADILQALHPTPAVGGVPTAKALKNIRATEPFSRGWFAGSVGCLGRDHVDFVVAIRSALVLKNVMKVYAGAGIVEGSIAQNEWDEVENKIGNLLRVIGS